MQHFDNWNFFSRPDFAFHYSVCDSDENVLLADFQTLGRLLQFYAQITDMLRLDRREAAQIFRTKSTERAVWSADRDRQWQLLTL